MFQGSEAGHCADGGGVGRACCGSEEKGERPAPLVGAPGARNLWTSSSCAYAEEDVCSFKKKKKKSSRTGRVGEMGMWDKVT